MGAVAEKLAPASEAERFVALIADGDLPGACEVLLPMASAVAGPWARPCRVREWALIQLRKGWGDAKAEQVVTEIWEAARAEGLAWAQKVRDAREAPREPIAVPASEPVVEALVKPEAARPAPKPVVEPNPAWTQAPKPPSGASAVERLTYPLGLLGHATQYVEDTAALPDRWLSMATALSALAKGLDRKVVGPTDSGLVLWVLLIAETGAGKQHALNCLDRLLRAMGAEGASVGSGLASVQAVEEILEGTATIEANPSPLIVIDEVGAWLKRISSKQQGGNVSEIPGILQTLWGWPPSLEWRGTKKVNKVMNAVHGPAFSLFGDSTEAKFIRALTREQVSNGFVNRMLLVNVGRGADEQIDPKYSWEEIPRWLATALKKVVGDPRPAGPMLLKMPNGVVLRDFRRIGWGEGVKELWRAFDKNIRGMPSVEDRELWIRAPEYALRLATVQAVFCGSKIVETVHWEWAKGFVEYSMRQLAAALRKNMSEDLDQADLVETIRQEFQRHGALTQGRIRKHCERKTNDYRKIDQAIEHLVTCGDIVELDQQGKVGRPSRKWEWQG